MQHVLVWLELEELSVSDGGMATAAHSLCGNSLRAKGEIMEECYECENPTKDQGIICECGKGPFCPDCWLDHKAVCKEAQGMDE